MDRPSIEKDRAGAAFANTATLFGARETELFAKESQKGPVRRHLHLNRFPVEFEFDPHVIHRVTRSPSPSPSPIKGREILLDFRLRSG